VIKLVCVTLVFSGYSGFLCDKACLCDVGFLRDCFECLIIINSMLCVQKQSDYTGSCLFRVQLIEVSGKRVIVFIATFDNIGYSGFLCDKACLCDVGFLRVLWFPL
jgi:hypothetical protein